MANEISLTAKLSAAKGSTRVAIAPASDGSSSLTVNWTGNLYVAHRQSINHLAAVAIDLGQCPVGGWGMFINRDATNYIELRQASGASDFCRLNAGEFAMFRLSPDMSAPFAIANTAPCDLDYLIMEP